MCGVPPSFLLLPKAAAPPRSCAGGPSARSLLSRCRQRLFAGLVRLVTRQPFDPLRHETSLPSHTTGFDLPEPGCTASIDLGIVRMNQTTSKTIDDIYYELKTVDL